MAAPVMRMHVQAEGSAEALRAFKRLPKEATAALRDQSIQLAGLLASKGKTAAAASGRQGPLLAPTVVPRRDRVVSVQAGGAKRVGRRGAPAYALLFGSEFGSDRFPQFGKPHRGGKGYWLFPQAEENAAEITAAWNQAADAVVAEFSKGG